MTRVGKDTEQLEPSGGAVGTQSHAARAEAGAAGRSSTGSTQSRPVTQRPIQRSGKRMSLQKRVHCPRRPGSENESTSFDQMWSPHTMKHHLAINKKERHPDDAFCDLDETRKRPEWKRPDPKATCTRFLCRERPEEASPQRQGVHGGCRPSRDGRSRGRGIPAAGYGVFFSG